ncbi:putative protease YdeA [Bacillus sp. J14TS2]|uniref:type 1 glutamine amidotransferase family protein n=1 Tax=Bacillus sp. J14TS2 TaxID=2807188 RepID=UPI001B1C1273|nr:type 1 glutamine amidotransferase family protein [Bacillus sp. J14TS2]GIN74930.1 putative protease YdeA [Bacillus sp. J14TS2]
MKKALFLILDEYADWEGAYLSAELNQREDWSVETVSLDGIVSSIGGFKTSVDYIIGHEPKDFNLLVMIGGNSWSNDSKKLLNLINTTLQNNIPIGAICGAVDYLAKNGFLNDYNHTGNSVEMWQDYKSYNPKSSFLKQQAVKDKNLVTANGTAPIEFTHLVLELLEFDTSENIKKMMYMYKHGFYHYCERYGNPF